MIHDEPSHRPGQDPYAYAPETEEHYGERIRAYQELLEKCRASGGAPDTTLRHLERELERYQGYLHNLIARKRHDGVPIRYEYAQPEDTVFIEGECPFTGGGTRYTKQQMLDVCMRDDIAARRLTTACLERGVKRFDKVSEDGYESFTYNASLAELRSMYGSETVYNRVVLVHDDFRLTEIVFDNGLDHVVGDADPVSDFEAWDRRMDEVREVFQDFSRATLGKDARLVRFSPATNYIRGSLPLFEAHGDGDRAFVIESQAVRGRTELAVDIEGDEFQSKLQKVLDQLEQDEHERPSCRP